jgi:hypothetical protein
MKKLPLLSLIPLWLILGATQCPPSTSLPVYSVVVEVPACINQAYHLKPGEEFRILIGELADPASFQVRALLQDRDINIDDDLTASFEPRPLVAGNKVTATPPVFQWREGIHGGIWTLVASADFAQTPSREPHTSWTCTFYPFTVSMTNTFNLKVGETQTLNLYFSERSVAAMAFTIEPLHQEAGDNLDAVTVNGYNPRVTAKGTLNANTDRSSVRILGNEEGTMTLFFKFPGGKMESVRVNVSRQV